MDVKRIVIIVFVLLVVLYLMINAFSKTTQLSTMADGKVYQHITYDKLKNNKNSSNFTYSMWLYVDDWNYKFGEEKNVLTRNNSPDIVLGDKPNTLKVKMNYYSAAGKKSATPVGASASSTMNAATQAACAACAAGYTCACDQCNSGVSSASGEGMGGGNAGQEQRAVSSVNTCLIENIPIQKWFNIIVSLYGRTLDVYLDGKLVRTCVMPGVPQVNNRSNINITSGGGFSGWTTKFNFWADATNPQEAYNIYKSGFGGSILGNALSKYRVQVALLKDNKQKGAFQI